ncbi:MAG: hypothetical protein ACE5JP_13215 [Candidatus Bipolaricaulia bacterium]
MNVVRLQGHEAGLLWQMDRCRDGAVIESGRPVPNRAHQRLYGRFCPETGRCHRIEG